MKSRHQSKFYVDNETQHSPVSQANTNAATYMCDFDNLYPFQHFGRNWYSVETCSESGWFWSISVYHCELFLGTYVL